MTGESPWIEAQLRHLEEAGRLDLPLPGSGHTRARFHALFELGRGDLSLARLAEAHADAVAIQRETGCVPERGRLCGVWASHGRHGVVRAERVGECWRLRGTKQYCSGATILDEALVSAASSEGVLLFRVGLAQAGVHVHPGTWATPAMAEAATTAVDFDVIATPSHQVGGAGFYLDRPSFWQGSVGVAACWTGGAVALADRLAMEAASEDLLAQAAVGAALAASWELETIIAAAADEIDADPLDRAGRGMVRALIVRHLVERACTEVIDLCARTLGPGPLAFDAEHARRVADLQLFIRQHHGDHDLAAAARAARSQ